jgi:hypothetical protein
VTESTSELPPPPPRASLRDLIREHWQKLALEMFSVVTGVVLGMQVSNWNDERREQAEIHRLLDQLRPELELNLNGFRQTANYYGVVRQYADTAFGGWRRDPGVSDADFVVAAYQASQVVAADVNDAAWSSIFGGAELRRIDDLPLRQALIGVLAAGTGFLGLDKVDTPYRQHVRRIIPEDVQDAVRQRCGDKVDPTTGAYTLPPHCNAGLTAPQAARAAAALRAEPDLAGDLRWHLSAQASFLANLRDIARRMQRLSDRIRDGRN